MDIIHYSEENRIFRESLRKYLAKEVIPHVEEWEEAGIVHKRDWRGLGAQGFLCMQVPEEYGGLGADFLYSVIVTEELSRTNHTGLAASLHSDIIVPYITARIRRTEAPLPARLRFRRNHYGHCHDGAECGGVIRRP